MKNIYQHNIELEPIRINNADKATFSLIPQHYYKIFFLST